MSRTKLYNYPVNRYAFERQIYDPVENAPLMIIWNELKKRPGYENIKLKESKSIKFSRRCPYHGHFVMEIDGHSYMVKITYGKLGYRISLYGINARNMNRYLQEFFGKKHKPTTSKYIEKIVDKIIDAFSYYIPLIEKTKKDKEKKEVQKMKQEKTAKILQEKIGLPFLLDHYYSYDENTSGIIDREYHTDMSYGFKLDISIKEFDKTIFNTDDYIMIDAIKFYGKYSTETIKKLINILLTSPEYISERLLK